MPDIRSSGPVVDRTVLMDMGRVSAAQSSLMVAENLGLGVVYFTLRNATSTSDGAEMAGLFAAAWGLGRANISLLMRSLGSFVHPRYAAAPSDEVALAEVGTAVELVLGVSLGTFMIIASLREPLFIVLKSSEYIPAAGLLMFFLVGDLARMCNWLHLSALLYRKHHLAYSVIALTTWGSFTSFCALLVPSQGLDGVGYAYLLSFGSNLALTTAVMWKVLGRPRLRYLPKLMGCIGTILAVGTLTSMVPWSRVVFVLVGAGLVASSPIARLVLQKILAKLGLRTSG